MKTSFAVYDEHGNIWPPYFRSRLTDPNDRLSMVKPPTREDERDTRAVAVIRATGCSFRERLFRLIQARGPLSREKINALMGNAKPKRIGSALANLKISGRVSIDTRGCYGGRGSGGVWSAISNTAKE